MVVTARIRALPLSAPPSVVDPPRETRDRAVLERLRRAASRSRLVPRCDTERACFLLYGEPTASAERTAILLFRALDREASTEIAFHKAGATTLSAGEIWLLRLLEAWRCGRHANAAALVHWRVRPAGRRWIRFLTARLAEELDALD